MRKKILFLILTIFLIVISLTTIFLIEQIGLTGFIVKDSGGLKVLTGKATTDQNNNIDTSSSSTETENDDTVTNINNYRSSSGGGGGGGNDDGICIPNCGGKECGDDGCGGSCGSCQDGKICSSKGLCIYIKTAEVFISPSITNQIKEEFTININIKTETEIFAAEFELSFNSSLLEALEVTEGDFLKKDGASTSMQNACPVINNTKGTIKFANTRLGTTTGINGNGSLAEIKFNAKDIGNSQLILENVQLTDPSLEVEKIKTNIKNGYVNISY